jgi:hypothetical protein
MPRHPRIALTSRLRIHTTNDRFGTRLSSACRALSRGLAGLERHPSRPPCGGHSQLDNLSVRRMLFRSPAEAVDREETHAATASISRTHSQCQRGATAPSFREPELAKIWSSCLEKCLRPSYTLRASAGSLRRCATSGWLASRSCAAAKAGGASRDRTGDLKLAKLALSQLSYGPSYARLAASFGGQARWVLCEAWLARRSSAGAKSGGPSRS